MVYGALNPIGELVSGFPRASAALLTLWQARQAPTADDASEMPAVPGLASAEAGVFQAATQVSNSSWGMTITLKRIQAWSTPQNSAHSP